MRVTFRQMVFAFLLGVISIFSINAETINDKYLQTQWTTENGLPQNSISAMAQTPDGYLWLGTFGGLARFDGVRFKIFTTANTPELKSNRISALVTDAEGKLWIGTESGEIICHKNGKFLLLDDGKEIANTSITEFYLDERGLIWAGNGHKLRICENDHCRNANFEKAVSHIRRDSEGIFWLLSDFKLFRQNGDGYVRDENIEDDVISIETDVNGGIWVVKKEEFGIYHKGEYKTLGKFEKNTAYAGTSIAPDGNLLITFNKFLYSVRKDNPENFEIYEIKNVRGFTARDIFIDKDGTIWCGRVGDGLIRLLNRRVQTVTGDAEHPFTAVNSIAEDADGNMWLATNQGLYRIKDGNHELVLNDKKNEYPARGSLLVDSYGILWNVTSEGLIGFEQGEIKYYKEISWEKASSGNSLFEDRRKNLWYGSEGGGVIVSDRQKIIAKYTTANGLVGNTVNFIHESADGTIWLATRRGISRLKDGIFTNYTSENGLSNEYVRDIYEDADGTFWFGTYGGGLNRFKNGKFTAITTENGLFDDIVSRILVDDEDNFWMLGNRGIYSVSRRMLNDFADGNIKQIFCAAFTTADGMVTSEGNGGYQWAGMRARDGKFWFPMINGAVVIDPKQEKPTPPKPLIEEVFLSGKPVDTSQKVEINPGSESLEINYTGLNFRKPEQIRFRYRLAGLDENWTDAGTRRLANYPYLPSGNYRFQLSAANADGVWSDRLAEFEIVVYPPFWRTWWFLLLLLLIAGLLIFGAFRYRSWRFARTRLLQEEYARTLLNAQETERRLIAADIHDNLGQQLLVIKNWAGYCLANIPQKDKIRPQIAQIDETAAQALDEVRALAKNLSPYHLDKAGLTNTLRFMIGQVAEAGSFKIESGIENIDDFLPKKDEIYLYRIVQEAMNNIVKHSRAKNVRVSAIIAEDKLIMKISDDGKGFLYYQTESKNFGHGLNGMIKRAEMMNGSLNIHSTIGRGTLLVLEIERND